MTRLLPLLLLALLCTPVLQAREFTDAYAAHVKGDYKRAIELYTAAATDGALSTEERAKIHNNRGSALSVLGYFNAAVLDFTTALELIPEAPRLLYSRGVNHFYLGNFTASMADFDSAMRLEPDNAYAVIWLYLAKRRAGESNADIWLAKRAEDMNLDAWPGPVIAWYLDKSTLKELVARVRDETFQDQVAKTCEAGFYVGERMLIQLRHEHAERWLATAVATCKPSFVEFTGARAELARLGESGDNQANSLASSSLEEVIGQASSAAQDVPPTPAAQVQPTVAVTAPADLTPPTNTSSKNLERTSSASAPVSYMVTTASVNVRSGPGVRYRRVAGLAQGETVQVQAQVDEWFVVRLSDGVEGHIHGDFLMPLSVRADAAMTDLKSVGAQSLTGELDTKAESVDVAALSHNSGNAAEVSGESTALARKDSGADEGVRVTLRSVNLRSGPSTSNDSMGALEPDTWVNVLGEVQGWVHVQVQDTGVEGYVYKRFLSDAPVNEQAMESTAGDDERARTSSTGERVVTTASVNVRVGPGTQYRRLGTLSEGTELLLQDRVGEWIHVRVDGLTTGYVHQDFVRPGRQDPGASLGAALVSAMHTHVTTARVNYRAGPGTEFELLGRLEKGVAVTVDGENGQWQRLLLSDGLRAFVHGEFLAAAR